MRSDFDSQRHVDRLARATAKIAHLVLMDPTYAPIFDRLDAELEAASQGGSAVDQARAMLRVRKLATA